MAGEAEGGRGGGEGEGGEIRNDSPCPPPCPHSSWALRVGGSFMVLHVHRNNRAY